MAVTQGLGDGFALYNGVKLPNIDSVWTEELKAQYPYAWMNYVYLAEEQVGEGTLWLCNYPVSVAFDVDGDINVTAQSDGTCIVYSILNGIWREEYGIPVDEWEKWFESITYDVSKGTFWLNEPTWTSNTILNTDGSTYMEATDPIPLDGMNVIEWDGDTSGLTAHASKANYYAVATGSVDATTAQAVLSDGTISADWYLSEGGNIYLYSDGTTYTSLLAYTEAVAPKWQFSLRDFLSGIAAGAASRCVLPRQQKEPLAYLYNGVQLPPLPEYDAEKYPYALIYYYSGAKSYMLVLGQSVPVFNPNSWTTAVSSWVQFLSGEMFGYSFWTDKPERGWGSLGVTNVDGGNLSADQPFIWTNSDIINTTDNSVYLASSEPIPVYGEVK